MSTDTPRRHPVAEQDGCPGSNLDDDPSSFSELASIADTDILLNSPETWIRWCVLNLCASNGSHNRTAES